MNNQDLTNRAVFMHDSKNIHKSYRNKPGRVFLHRHEHNLVVVRMNNGSVMCSVGDFYVVPIDRDGQLLY